jgi:hypothetical protein
VKVRARAGLTVEGTGSGDCDKSAGTAWGYCLCCRAMPPARSTFSVCPHERSFGLLYVMLFIASMLGVACAPEIGDSCETALDCSASGTRLCDRTQPEGYCTLDSCEQGTCPEEAVCVQFGRGRDGTTLDRLSRSYCMYKCDERDDCRPDEGYDCFSARTFGASNEALVLGSAAQKFCAPLAPVDNLASMPDAISATPPESLAAGDGPESAGASGAAN